MKTAKTSKATTTIGILAVSAVLFAGCSGTSDSAGGTSSPAASAPVAAAAATAPAASAPAASAPAATAAAKTSGKELKGSEKIAQDFVNVMMNGTDAEAKKKFIADNMHEDIKPLFELMPPTYEAIKNPKVVETVKVEEDGETAEAVLVQGDSKKETVILLMDGKVALAFSSGGSDASQNEMFNEVRKEFKTAAAK